MMDVKLQRQLKDHARELIGWAAYARTISIDIDTWDLHDVETLAYFLDQFCTSLKEMLRTRG